MSEEDKDSGKVKLCELCEDQPAIVLCSECCKCYCDRCTKMVHEFPKLKEHKREDIPEGIKINGMCPLHEDKPLDLFCVEEVKLCCSSCKAEELHKGHTVVKITDINEDNEIFSASEVRARLKYTLEQGEKMENDIKMRAENTATEIEEEREEIKKNI